jgi:LPXTG-motif cell wall-anchored protein
MAGGGGMGMAAAGGASRRGRLPRTGGEPALFIAGGAGLIGLGLLLRRRRQPAR